MTTWQKSLPSCSEVFSPLTTSIGPTNSSMNTWRSATRLWALPTSPPTTNSFSTGYSFIFWFLLILFFFDQKSLLTDAILSQTIQFESCGLYFLGRTNLFFPFDYSIRLGLSLGLFCWTCSGCTLMPSNGSRGATMGDCRLPYSGRRPRSWGQHFYTILSLVHQRGTWLGCTGYIKSSRG